MSEFMWETDTGTIYAAILDTGVIKVGLTGGKIKCRLSSLRIATPRRFDLLFAFETEDSKNWELYVLRALRRHRIHGREWFKPSALGDVLFFERMFREQTRGEHQREPLKKEMKEVFA